jgi:hypothetical protein
MEEIGFLRKMFLEKDKVLLIRPYLMELYTSFFKALDARRRLKKSRKGRGKLKCQGGICTPPEF